MAQASSRAGAHVHRRLRRRALRRAPLRARGRRAVGHATTRRSCSSRTRPSAAAARAGVRRAARRRGGAAALLVCEATRQHVTVALVGDGGDEAFAGYERYAAHALAGGRVPRRRRARRARSGAPRARREPRSTPFRAARFLEVAAAPRGERYERLMEVFPPTLRARALDDEASAHAPPGSSSARRRRRRHRPPAARRRDLPPGRPAAEGRPRLDGALARAALAAPRPRVVELGLSLPDRLSSRAARQGRAPAGVRGRAAAPRSPAAARRASASRSPLVPRGAARARRRPAARRRARDRGLFRPAAVERLLGEHVAGRADHAHRLWCLSCSSSGSGTVGRTPGARARRVTLVVRSPSRVAAAALVLLLERGDILAAFTEKSDDFARTFVASGTFGFVPGEPSAWTQPLYGFLLVPIYWIFGRSWWAVGLAQIAVAVATALARLRARPPVRLARARASSPRSSRRSTRTSSGTTCTSTARSRRAARRGARPARAARGERRSLGSGGRARAPSPAWRSSATRASSCCPLVLAGFLLWRRTRRGSRRRRSSPCAVARLRAVGRPQRGRGRLRDDHDRRARALEGEQRADLRHARAAAAGSTTSRASPAARSRPSRPPTLTPDGRAGASTSARRCGSTARS